MTTLKLSKKTSNSPKARKAPVRRTDPSKRDRSVAPPKRVRVESENTERSNESRQRNHRHDGSLHDSQAPRQNARPPQQTDARDNDYRPERNSADTRTKPRANREEPHYRQSPKRHGKARDGFDAAEQKPKAVDAEPSVSDLPRLSKVMAERGFCSRREADEWIFNGWVKVDGEIMETLGTRISPDADIQISEYAYEAQSEQVTILLNKPISYVSGQAEDGYNPAIVLVHPDNQWEEDPNQQEFQRMFLQGLAPAGRLDIDSTGLLVLTQDGRIARHLIGSDTKVEKEYLVRVEGELDEEGLTKLNYGLSLDGVKLKPAKVSWQNEDQLRFVLREGKKRQIRRMCELVGLHVVGLKRVRIGSVNLGNLPVGEWRYLDENERF